MKRNIACICASLWSLSDAFTSMPSRSHGSSGVPCASNSSLKKLQRHLAHSDDVGTTPKWDVDLYQKHRFVFGYGDSVVSILDPKPGERVLDVGCGSGELTEQISKSGAIAIGMDADPNMVERAREVFSDLDFILADIASFQWDEEPVDAVFSNAALHWVKDAEGAVQSMTRVLKPGGRFVVEFGGNGNVERIVNASLKVLGLPPSHNPWYFPGIAEYSNLLEKHGVEVLSATIFDRPTLLEDGEEGMANWLRMFGGKLLQHVPAESVESVIAEISEELRPKLFDGKQWTADYRRLRIVGRKL